MQPSKFPHCLENPGHFPFQQHFRLDLSLCLNTTSGRCLGHRWFGFCHSSCSWRSGVLLDNKMEFVSFLEIVFFDQCSILEGLPLVQQSLVGGADVQLGLDMKFNQNLIKKQLYWNLPEQVPSDDLLSHQTEHQHYIQLLEVSSHWSSLLKPYWNMTSLKNIQFILPITLSFLQNLK